ncbi:MAG: GTPase HflX [Kofleriaceae bacterium]|nr:GTPase HflX [Kofleriaceae bacterium]
MSEFRFESLGADPTAVVVGVQLPGVTEAELISSLEELERLATTLGLRPVGRVTQRRGALAPGKVVGDGKLHELARWTGGTGEVPAYQKPGKSKDDDDDEVAAAADADGGDDDGDDGRDGEGDGDGDGDGEAAAAPPTKAKVVLVDHELSPTQQRNLEKATGVDVLDRTSVILEIFQRHAKTREARLQVEIARLRYLAPRLRESGGGADRVRGGVGGKGAGESSLELDRRRIRDRIAELRHELAQIEGNASVRRNRRSDLPTVALVGYTNAGKSSLMRALTGSEVYVADKLFATLDTTVRALHPRTEPPILVSDTVGFIKQLPHDLVASFRSTLEEAREADLLLHVLDAADAAMEEQREVTRSVLAELGAGDQPVLIVLNKADKLSDEARAELALRYPDAVLMSAKRPADVAALRDRLIAHFIGALVEDELVVPWAQHRLVGAIHTRTTVVEQTHTDEGTVLRVRAPAQVLDALRAELGAS